jgi:hypothetical protein
MPAAQITISALIQVPSRSSTWLSVTLDTRADTFMSMSIAFSLQATRSATVAGNVARRRGRASINVMLNESRRFSLSIP